MAVTPASDHPRTTSVLVVGASSVAELAVARGLASGGYRPSLVTWDPRGPAAHSRVLEAVLEAPSPLRDPSELARCVSTAARRVRAAAILPGTEAALLVLASVADRQDRKIAIGCPSWATVTRATDKWSVGEAATRADLGQPPTARVDDDHIPEVSLPAVVKSTRSEYRRPDGGLEHVNVCVVRSKADLRAAIARVPEALVQPHLEAPMRTVNGVAWEGDIVVSVHQRADRIWRPDAGMVCAAHTVARDAALDRRCARLLADLGWSGIFNLQFLHHDGSPLLIDLNPRPYQSLALAVAAGANLPAIWADLVLGRTPRVEAYEVGLHWHYRRDDLRALAAVRARRARSVASGLMPRRRAVPAVFSIRDPGPALALVRQDLRRVLGSSGGG